MLKNGGYGEMYGKVPANFFPVVSVLDTESVTASVPSCHILPIRKAMRYGTKYGKTVPLSRKPIFRRGYGLRSWFRTRGCFFYSVEIGGISRWISYFHVDSHFQNGICCGILIHCGFLFFHYGICYGFFSIMVFYFSTMELPMEYFPFRASAFPEWIFLISIMELHSCPHLLNRI